MHVLVATLSKSSDVHDRSHLSVAMGYFGGIFILLVVHCVLFAQVLFPVSLSVAEFSRVSNNASSSIVYTVSQRSDWFQAVAGNYLLFVLRLTPDKDCSKNCANFSSFKLSGVNPNLYFSL